MATKQSVTRPAASDLDQLGFVIMNPDGSDISGPGAGTSDVNIVSIDGTVPTLTIDNLNVALSHADATPDSVRIGDGTTLIENDFGVSTAAFRVAALPGDATAIFDVATLAAAQLTQGATTNNIPLNAGVILGWDGATHRELAVDTSGNLQIEQGGLGLADSVRNDYTGTNVTTGAFVELIASTAAISKELEIFDSSGETLELATGAAASEVRVAIITPGGNGRIPIGIAAGTRVSVKAISATASVGELDINLYG